jgi:hypothetical protein
MNKPMEARATVKPTIKTIQGKVARLRLARKGRRRGLAGGSIGGAGAIVWFDCQSTQVPGAGEGSAADSAAGPVNVAAECGDGKINSHCEQRTIFSDSADLAICRTVRQRGQEKMLNSTPPL